MQQKRVKYSLQDDKKKKTPLTYVSLCKSQHFNHHFQPIELINIIVCVFEKIFVLPYIFRTKHIFTPYIAHGLDLIFLRYIDAYSVLNIYISFCFCFFRYIQQRRRDMAHAT